MGNEGTEFKRGQTVYDLHGGEYLYADRVIDGHYVNSIVLVQGTNYAGDDYYEETTEGPLVHLREVFASPPKQKINDEITALSETKKELASHVTDLQREERDITQRIARYKNDLEMEIKKYPHHQMFLHAASGNDLVILDKKTGYNHGISRTHAGKLIFDIRSGSFEGVWDANYDGDVPVVAFKSLRDAQQYFLKNYDLSFRPEAPMETAGRYISLDLPLPPDLQQAVEAYEAEKKERRREQLVKSIEEAQRCLDAMAASEGTS